MSPKCEEMIALLRDAAEALNRRKARDTDVVYLFCPQYVVAELIGVDPSTIRRWFYRYPQLKRVVNCAYHCATMEDGRRMKDGMIWAVSLAGERSSALRFPREVFREKLRDFEGDMKLGRTLHGPYQRHPEPSQEILTWTLPELAVEPPLEDSPCNTREAVYGAVDNSERIPAAAHFLVELLGDVGRHRLWMKTLWRAKRGELSPSYLVDAIERTLADVREGFARSGPRLLTSRIV